MDVQRLQEQQQFFKSDVPTSIYQLSTCQNSVQLLAANNAPVYTSASLESSVPRAYPVYQVFDFSRGIVVFFCTKTSRKLCTIFYALVGIS